MAAPFEIEAANVSEPHGPRLTNADKRRPSTLHFQLPAAAIPIALEGSY
jgi:hypothetical protein